MLLESGLRGDIIRSRISRNKNESAGDEYKFDTDTAKTAREKSTQNIRVYVVNITSTIH